MKTLDISKPTLTSRQKEIYEFLREKILTRGYGPTVREIGLKFDIKSPNGVMCHLKALERKGMISRESHMSRAIQLANPPQQLTRLPYIGQLAIGKHFPASNPHEHIDLSDLFGSQDHCCMKVQGDGLREEHINDEDIVVIRRQPTFADGDLAVIVYENGETAVRRLFQDGTQIRVESPRNDDEPQIVNRVIVVGVLIGVIRLL